MSRQTNEYLLYDRQDTDGRWIQTWCENRNGARVQIHTLSARRWNGLIARCNPNGNVHKARQTYKGCDNGFSSYQDFADWSSTFPGAYSADENGKIFHLDKDLIQPGSKVYSRDTCCFIPAKINSMIVFPPKNPHGHPRGVGFHRVTKKFYAHLNSQSGEPQHLGYFHCPLEAHKAWQKAKADRILSAASHLPSELRAAIIGLERLAASILDDLKHNRESIL